MQSVADLVEPNRVEDLATPSNYHLGCKIYDADRISFHKMSPHEVVAHVASKNGQSRNVSLRTDGLKLIWQCSCTSDVTLFCKHLVAAALATWEKAPQVSN